MYTALYVQGDDVCALEKELSLEARLNAADVKGGGIDGTRDGARMESSGGGKTLAVAVGASFLLLLILFRK